MREKYVRMKELNDHLLKQLETDQQEVDRLTMKKKELEEVCVAWFCTKNNYALPLKIPNMYLD